jgi:hypothetical protein
MSRQVIDRAGDSRSTESVVDIHDRDAGGAAVQHRQKRRNSAKTRAVPDARRNGDYRNIHQASHDAWQRAFHSGHHDQHACGYQPRVLRQKTVEAGNADVVKTVYGIAHNFRGHCRFLRDRQICRPGCSDYNRSLPLFDVRRRPRNRPGQRSEYRVRYSCRDRGMRSLIRSGDQQAVSRCDDPLGNCGNLLRALSRTENHLRETLTSVAVMVDPRKSQILERCLAQILKDALVCGLRRIEAGLNPLQQGKEFVTCHRS